MISNYNLGSYQPIPINQIEQKDRKIAIIMDWLVTFAGGERVLSNILSIYPEADLFSLIDFFSDNHRKHLQGKKAQVSFIQKLPLARSKYQFYLPLMPLAIERFDLSKYHLIISCSHAVAKGVLTQPSQLHICYLQARNLKYAYEDRSLYRSGSNIVDLLQDTQFSRMRIWDKVASQRPDVTVAPSYYVSRWHKHRHGISSDVIYPPVDVTLFQNFFKEKKDDYYVTVSRLEPYKRVDLIISAFNKLNKKLIVIGSGTKERYLRKIANGNIHFMGYQEGPSIAKYVSGAKAFIFTSREDWGIAPVEAQACGTPVIAFGQGGVRETIKPMDSVSPTGLFFNEQSADSIIEAVLMFEKERGVFSAQACRDNSTRFSSEAFRENFKSYIESSFSNFSNR